VLSILQMLTLNSLYSQKEVLYHQFSARASSWNIVKWNIEQVGEKEMLLEEYVDEAGRVIELCFYKKGNLEYKHLCYLANRVTFEYKENKIIESLYSNNNPVFWTDCEKNHKSIYHLDEDGYIVRLEYVYAFNPSEEVSENLNRKIITSEDRQLQVGYYYYSFAKMDGKYPVSRDYKFSDDFYYGDFPEKSSILNGLKASRY